MFFFYQTNHSFFFHFSVIFVGADWSAKIGGFGINIKSSEQFVRWQSPEVKANKPPSEKSDVWSYGLIIYSCFMRDDPYKNMSLDEIKKQKKGPKLENPVIQDLTNTYANIMQQVKLTKGRKQIFSQTEFFFKCFMAIFETRPTFQELINQLEPKTKAKEIEEIEMKEEKSDTSYQPFVIIQNNEANKSQQRTGSEKVDYL